MDYKNFFSLPEDGVYLNCAAQGPLCKAASQSVLKSLKDKEAPFEMTLPYMEKLRSDWSQAVAQLTQCEPSQLALASGTSWGINLLAQGLELQTGDEVIVMEGQFPSNVAPWEVLADRGVKVVKFPAKDFIFDLGEFQRHLSSRTKIASLEWVHFLSGDLIPLHEIIEDCRRRNILIALDPSQGVGAIPFSVKDYDVDVVACSAYKWMLSPYGSGFLALKPELMDRLKTCMVGWLNMQSCCKGHLTDYELDFYKTGQRFDIFSMMGFLNAAGMTSAVGWLNTLDLKDTFKQVSLFCQQMEDGLDSKKFRLLNQGPAERRSLIATFEIRGLDPANLSQVLRDRKFAVSVYGNHMRVSPNIYNDSSQIEKFIRLVNNV